MKEVKPRNLFIEKIIEKFFFLAAMVGVVSVIAIIVFVFYKGTQPFFRFDENGYSFLKFITGTVWRPGSDEFGIFYMIVASILATGGAILVGVPIGVLTAVFIAEIANPKLNKILKPGIELLAGIPSVLYGLFGLSVIVPILMKISPQSQGQSMLAVIIVLTVMILPTVVSIAEGALRAVPNSYREASLALGASYPQTIFRACIPAAKSGILAGVVLGIGRAIGETMAVMLIAGNPIAGIPTSIFDPIRPLTTNIAIEMGYAFGLHQEMLFATGVVLFTFIMILNLVLNKITSKAGDR